MSRLGAHEQPQIAVHVAARRMDLPAAGCVEAERAPPLVARALPRRTVHDDTGQFHAPARRDRSRRRRCRRCRASARRSSCPCPTRRRGLPHAGRRACRSGAMPTGRYFRAPRTSTHSPARRVAARRAGRREGGRGRRPDDDGACRSGGAQRPPARLRKPQRPAPPSRRDRSQPDTQRYVVAARRQLDRQLQRRGRPELYLGRDEHDQRRRRDDDQAVCSERDSGSDRRERDDKTGPSTHSLFNSPSISTTHP